MMKKTLKLIVCIVLLYTNLQAQDAKLINNYKFRVKAFAGLNLEGDVSGKLRNEKANGTDKANTKSNTIIDADYFYISNTDKRILNIAASTLLGYDFKSGRQNASTEKSNASLIGAGVTIQNREYFNKYFYTELGLRMHTRMQYTKKSMQLPTKDIENKNVTLEVTPNIGIGYGRMEAVGDMRSALWLLRNLKRVNALAADLSEEEKIQLAQAITQARNTRLLDNRRYLINLLKKIDVFLKSTGKINTSSIDYFTTLNDVLYFANIMNGTVGRRAYINSYIGGGRLNGRSETYMNPNTSVEKVNTKLNNRVLVLGYEDNKALGLAWQRSAGIELQYRRDSQNDVVKNLFNNTVVSNTNYDFKSTGWAVLGSYGYSFYPNTRTNIKFGTNVFYGLSKANSVKTSYSGFSLGGSSYYFISYTTAVQCDAGIGYYNNIGSDGAISNNSSGLLGDLTLKLLITL